MARWAENKGIHIELALIHETAVTEIKTCSDRKLNIYKCVRRLGGGFRHRGDPVGEDTQGDVRIEPNHDNGRDVDHFKGQHIQASRKPECMVCWSDPLHPIDIWKTELRYERHRVGRGTGNVGGMGYEWKIHDVIEVWIEVILGIEESSESDRRGLKREGQPPEGEPDVGDVDQISELDHCQVDSHAELKQCKSNGTKHDGGIKHDPEKLIVIAKPNVRD
ncbi:uncharacterized protein N7482_001084 [Penicillium canariense]|uniref:Uncharacterized protein n=1 Tax=Penicillium canariense TaxID=189055 RepID=A0A9W9IEZ7_9EURO|nr:uncharacterized protein N7482_001084 [Penicillium canariense]KAJ5175207.1 hypothetical protein N7482_001084 [Penicillium canariense]